MAFILLQLTGQQRDQFCSVLTFSHSHSHSQIMDSNQTILGEKSGKVQDTEKAWDHYAAQYHRLIDLV